ncbi:hypothetical protein Bca52824_062344 [Brassica carinata]|uniref:Uncharacterized protein n=1 Tax=Brassica carinata TaxID=52824 RepID=A0A8X7QHU6_BRACI|nr:hypothetical protein Bca52824_062344 [Brassica carinata]
MAEKERRLCNDQNENKVNVSFRRKGGNFKDGIDYPSGMMKAEEEGGFGWQVWHRNGTACPHGSFPIRRVEAEAELSEGKYGPLISDAADRATKGHQASLFHSLIE